MEKTHTKTLGNIIPKNERYACYAITLFGNTVINQLSSRGFRRWYYKDVDIKHRIETMICGCVKIIYYMKFEWREQVAVSWFADLDSRGEKTIDHNTNVSSQFELITGSYDIKDPNYTVKFIPMYIGHHCLIGTRATSLQDINRGDGDVFQKDILDYSVVRG